MPRKQPRKKKQTAPPEAPQQHRCRDAGGVSQAGKPCGRVTPPGERCAAHPLDPAAAAPGGRPKLELTPEDLIQIEELAAKGMTQRLIADRLGIADRTLRRRISEDPSLAVVFYRGKARMLERVSDLVTRRAAGDKAAIEQMDRTAATLAMFVLKTQAEWSEKQRIEHSGAVGIINQLPALPDDELARLEALSDDELARELARMEGDGDLK